VRLMAWSQATSGRTARFRGREPHRAHCAGGGAAPSPGQGDRHRRRDPRGSRAPPPARCRPAKPRPCASDHPSHHAV
ncbi:MAG: hypothetical protein FGM37_11650, partial [Phycisphaerales bacterium]|nr:hypothetical protein [Phycisphaerales bacterium]